ncbi:MAG: VPGUxxT family thioredoxin-like (seleno)protein, type 2 [Planctomycetota bacterium]
MSRLILLSILGVALLLFLVFRDQPQALAEAGVEVSPAAADNPIEVGYVTWGRDLDAAYARSAASGKPVLVLFQEVPGCHGCWEFGKNVLRDPLLVEAIEDEFEPVLVFNNQGGEDRRLLNAFSEPAWNYQVIRFLDAEGNDIIPRQDRVWTLGGVASRMIETLEVAERPVPRYLEALSLEQQADRHATGAFSMFCYWTGEVSLGQLDGVVATEAGWLDGREVTHVTYVPEIISADQLAEQARTARCAADKAYSPAPGNDRPARLGGLAVGELRGYREARASDQNRQLTGYETLLTAPGLTEMQTTKLNAFIRTNPAEALSWLSPRQAEFIKKETSAASRR